MKPVPAIAAVLAATALVLPTVSKAAVPDSVRVVYADLNLGSADGQQRLQHRIGYAADTVCELGLSLEVARMSQSRSCRAGAIARAEPAYRAAINDARRGTVTVLDAAALIVTAQ